MSEATTLPEGWGSATLADVSGSITSGATPEAGNPRYYTPDGGYAFAKIEDLTRARTREIEHCGLQITDAAVRETAAKIYPAGTILLSMYGTIGLTKVCAHSMAANQALCALLPPFRCDPGYLLHHLDYVRPKWSRYSGQTTQANINGSIVRAHVVPLPPRGDQEKIAAILDTLDTTIRQTEAIIAKLKQVRQGLLHDLLTRGIDANGELRPTQSQAPHLYKESPLGWIPSDWHSRSLSVACSLIRDGTHLPPVRVESGPLLLSVKNMKDGHLVITDQDTRVADTFYQLMHKSWTIQKGDVLLAIVGATIGKLALVGDLPKFTLQRSVAILRGTDGVLRNPFLFASMSHQAFQDRLWARVNQTAQPGIYLDQLGQLEVAVPPIEEQDTAIQHLAAIDKRIETERASLAKLALQRAGLMDDLLTGHVRVTPLLW